MKLRSNMFRRFGFLLALGGPMFCSAGESPERQIREMNQFQEYVLAQGEVYKIYVKKDDGVTTVTFPSAISKIAGVNVSTDGSTDFQISAQPGGYYFNLAALKEGAAGTLTVVFNRKTYILYLVQDNAKAFAAVNFTGGSGGGPGGRRPLRRRNTGKTALADRYGQGIRSAYAALSDRAAGIRNARPPRRCFSLKSSGWSCWK